MSERLKAGSSSLKIELSQTAVRSDGETWVSCIGSDGVGGFPEPIIDLLALLARGTQVEVFTPVHSAERISSFAIKLPQRATEVANDSDGDDAQPRDEGGPLVFQEVQQVFHTARQDRSTRACASYDLW